MQIIFEFSGGPFDGETVECDTSTQTGHEATSLYTGRAAWKEQQ